MEIIMFFFIITMIALFIYHINKDRDLFYGNINDDHKNKKEIEWGTQGTDLLYQLDATKSKNKTPKIDILKDLLKNGRVSK